jgi:hypothetical protein
MSTLKADTIVAADGSSPVTLTKQSAAKAWCSFDGSGTPAIDDSFNVASLTDAATGVFKTNFTNAMSSANHSNSFACRDGTAGQALDIDIFVNYARAVTSASYTHFSTQASGTTPVDPDLVNTTTNGDLA